MSDTIKNRSTEQLILDAIYYIENFRKKRTTIEHICNIIVSHETGLSKEDAVEMISQLHKEGILYIKRYESGPASYKVKKDSEEFNKANKGKNVEGESKVCDTEPELDCGEEEAEAGQVFENCTGAKDLIIDEYSDDGNISQASFIAFLDCVRSPEQAIPKHSGDNPILDSTTPINLCHGLQDQPFPPLGATVTLTKFVEIMGKMVATVNSHVEMLREEKHLNNMLRNTIEVMKDDIFSKKAKINELENTLAKLDKSIPDYNNYGVYSDGKYTSQNHPQMGAQKTCIGQPASKSLETPQQPLQPENSPSFESQLKNYLKAEREKYAEYVVKCKAEEMNASNGSKEGKQNAKKRKASKENNKNNDQDNRQSIAKPGILNNNAGKSQSRQRQHQNCEQQQQQSQNHQRNCNKNTGNVDKGVENVQGSVVYQSQDQSRDGGIWPKNTVLITGDSMLSNINERTLSKIFNTKVRSFPGATVADMFDYLKPLLKKRPDKVILVIGANDIEHTSSQEIVAKIKTLVDFIHGCLPECHVVISEVLKRADRKILNKKIDDVNKSLKSMGFDTLPQQNVTFDLLGKKGFHLNFFGNKQLAKNIIEKLRSFSH